jgi:hypothetical protein
MSSFHLPVHLTRVTARRMLNGGHHSALYIRGDEYETSDAVFGVKKSLIVDLEKVDKETAEEYGAEEGMWLLRQEFVLVTKEETESLRDRNAVEALEKLGLKMKLVDHLPVPELD